ncbi:MAG: hypothetical protein U9P14_00510 [Gemmatimonadota bacterium]|nr:hypothetical protein [Gemmatimonadota bacterium]
MNTFRVTNLKLYSALVVLILVAGRSPLPGQDTWFAAYDMALEAISQSRWDEAVTRLHESLLLKPEPELNARTYGVWRKNYLPFFHLGVACYNLGQYELARKQFEKSLASKAILGSPENMEALEGYLKAIAEQVISSQQEMATRIRDEYSKGIELERQGELEQALVKFESVLTLEPRNSKAADHLERINRELAHRRDLALKKRQADELLARSAAFLESGNLEEALKVFNELLSLMPEMPEALELRRQTLSRINDRALEESRKKRQLDELISSARRQYGRGRLERALELFNRALTLEPANAETAGYIEKINAALNERNRLEIQTGMLQEAAALIEEDSLIAARDKVILAKDLGLSLSADSLLALLDSLLAERDRSSRLRDKPQLVLNIPPDSVMRVAASRFLLEGTALDNDGIRRITAFMGGVEYEIYKLGEGQYPETGSRSIPFEQRLLLAEGENRIVVEVLDSKDMVRTAGRTVFFRPPIWREPFFMAGCMLIVIIAAGIYYYYKRSLIQYLLNRFRRHPFEVIVPNPFIVGNPIRSSEMFFGRQDDFSFVKAKVDNEQYGSLIVLFGERRAGKTSVLYQILGGRLGPEYLPIFIDMQAMAVNDDSEFHGRVAEISVEALGPDKIDFDLSVFENKSKNPYTLFGKFIDKLLKSVSSKKILLLFDEYELIEDKVEDGKLSKDIFLFLSGLVEHKAGLFLIFTGTHRLQDRKKAYWQPLLHRCDYRNISYLTENDTRRLITEPVRDKVFYLGSSVNDIMRLSAGQPFYTQLVCRNIVEMLNDLQRNYFFEEDIPSTVREILDNPPPQMIYFWAGLAGAEKITLSVIAFLSRQRDHFCSLEEICNSIRENSLPSTPGEVKTACERLIQREVLETNAKQLYHFRMDLFRIWIREEHNLYKVSREIEQTMSV